MQKRFGLTLFAGMAILVAACGPGAASTRTESAATSPRRSRQARRRPRHRRTEPSAALTADLKIGLVTDVGHARRQELQPVIDWRALRLAAEAIGGTGTDSQLSRRPRRTIAKNIQTFVDQEFDVIVTVGFARRRRHARAPPRQTRTSSSSASTRLRLRRRRRRAGSDVRPAPDAWAGDAATCCRTQWHRLDEMQPGYLAGIVAASLSKTGTSAPSAGPPLPAVVELHHRLPRTAPSRSTRTSRSSTGDVSAAPAAAFNDPARGQRHRGAVPSVQDVDVMFQVAGLTGNGVLQAACDAGIMGIGVDVDQSSRRPPTARSASSISAEKKLKKNGPGTSIMRLAGGTLGRPDEAGHPRHRTTSACPIPRLREP